MLAGNANFFLNGLVHTYYKNDIIISSPNMSYIPEFPELEEVGIYLRGGGFYGPQEFARWPQIFTQSLSHYSVIPAKPSHDTAHFYDSVLFRDFTSQDWDPVVPVSKPLANTGDIWTVIEFAGGFIRRDLWRLLNDALELAIRTCLSGHENDDSKPYALARALQNLGRSAMKRLEDAPDCASQVIFAIRDVQRIALELHGIYEWMTVIRSRLSGRRVYPPGQYLGCFTSKMAEAQMLYAAGIPVWVIRTRSSITDTMRLGNEISFTLVSSALQLDRWRCVNGSFLYSKEIKDGGRIRDCTGLVYDAALSEMMESIKTYCLFSLNRRVGGLEESQSLPKATAGKRKVEKTDP